MIPDDNPDSGLFMTLKDIRRILTDFYGLETGNRMPVHEIDQIIATLKGGEPVELLQAGMILKQEGGTGLYCAYVKNKEGS